MSDADDIWDRALDSSVEPETLGDRAIRDVLRFHGTVMNGGLLAAVELAEDSSDPSLDAVVEGYTVLGMPTAAALVSDAGERLRAADRESLDDMEELELDLDPRYETDDDALLAHLRDTVAQRPQDFTR